MSLFTAAIINLNVGGKKYTTTTATLINSTFLTNLLSSSVINEDNEIFLDRDGATFRHILQYLRTGKINLTEDEKLKELKTEALFYKMNGLVKEIDTLLNKSNKTVYSLVDKKQLQTSTGRVNEYESYVSTDNKMKKEFNIISTVSYLHLVWVCPRNIVVHKSPEHCGRKCNKIENCDHTGWVQENAEKYLISFEE